MQRLIKGTQKHSLIVARLKNGTATYAQVTQYFILDSELQTELMQAASIGQHIAAFYKDTTASRPYRSSYRTA